MSYSTLQEVASSRSRFYVLVPKYFVFVQSIMTNESGRTFFHFRIRHHINNGRECKIDYCLPFILTDLSIFSEEVRETIQINTNQNQNEIQSTKISYLNSSKRRILGIAAGFLESDY